MIIKTYSEEDMNDTISQIPFHIERSEDAIVSNNLSSFLFNDELLEEDPIEDIISILLNKAPLYSADNSDLGIIRDPGKKDVPTLFQNDQFWSTLFKYSLGPLYNELILYSYNRLKYPYINEISLLFDNILEDFEVPSKYIYFEETQENEELSDSKLNSTSQFLGYTSPQVEIMEYWIKHSIATGIIKESEEEKEIVLYKSQDLKNEIIRRKIAGSLAGYSALLNSINFTGSLYSTIPLQATGDILDPRLIRGISLPGVTTTIPDVSINPANIFDDIPPRTLEAIFYSSGDYNYNEFANAPSDFLRFKSNQVVWDNLRGIADLSLVKLTYHRLDQEPILDTLDSDPIRTLDENTPLFDLTVSSESFLDIEANRIFNINNSLKVKKGEIYPYYLDTVAQNAGPSLSDIPWLAYVGRSVEDKKRVSESVKLGVQLSLVDDSPEAYISQRELAFGYRTEMDSSTEDYVYNPLIHNYVFIYSVEIQYHRDFYTIRKDWPKKLLVSAVYIRQPLSSEDLSADYDSYNTFTQYSTGLLPFKFKEIRSENIPSLTLKIDETAEEKVVDYIEESGYPKGIFLFLENNQKNLLNNTTVAKPIEMKNLDVGFSDYPPTTNDYFFVYGYEHEDGIAYWSQMLEISRLDRLMALTEMHPDWYEKILHINPLHNFSGPNCFTEISGSLDSKLQSLSLTHMYDIYNNDENADTTTQLASGPIGFYLQKYRDPELVSPAAEIFQIWGDNREPSDALDDLVGNVYRNAIISDEYGIYNLQLRPGNNFLPDAVLDTYFDIVPATTVNTPVDDWPLWYWNTGNGGNSRNGMSFFADLKFNALGSSADIQALLTRKTVDGSGTVDSSAGDEFEIYYDKTNSKFVFNVYPTGYSVSNIATNYLGELIFQAELPWEMNVLTNVRMGFSYKLAPYPDDITKSTATLSIVIGGVAFEQKYTISQISTSGIRQLSPSTFTATYNVYDENTSTYLQVAGSNDITLNDAVFNYNEKVSFNYGNHFLGMLHKDMAQSNYVAKEINIFNSNHKHPFIGDIYDIRLHTCGFSLKEMCIYTRGSRKELLSNNIDSQKVHNHFAEKLILKKRMDDDPFNIIDSIKVFDRSKWRSILVDPYSFDVNESNPTNERYNPFYANNANDIDIFDGADDAAGVIKSQLKNYIEIVSGVDWAPGTELFYRGQKITTSSQTYDIVQTSLYPVQYSDFPLVSNAILTSDTGEASLKAYKTGPSITLPADAKAISIKTAPSGDTLIYKCDIAPLFKMNSDMYPTRGLYKGNRLEHTYDENLSVKAVKISESKEPASSLSRLLVMPLNIPTQISTTNPFLNSIEFEGLKIKDVLGKILNPASYYQEFVYPYDLGYRLDAIKALREGVYFIPMRMPMIIEADYNDEQRKLYRNLETLIKVEVVGTTIDNASALVTSTNITDFYEENTDGEINISKLSLDDNGSGAYRQITIKAWYYKCADNGTWSWSQILSNDITDIAGDGSLAYSSSDITISKPVEFYLTNRVDEDEFFDWSDTTQTFNDFSPQRYPDGRIEIYKSDNLNPSNTHFLRENKSYLMYLNLRSATNNIKFSPDVSCEPYDSKLFENPNRNNTIELLNERLTTIGLTSEVINYGYSVSGSSFEATDLLNGKLGDPYANDKTNQILNDLDYNFINGNIHTFRFVSFFSGNEAINFFPVGFNINENAYFSNVTTLYNSDGDLLEYNIDEKEVLTSHYNAQKLTKPGECINGFYVCRPVFDGNLPSVNEVEIAADAELYTYELGTASKSVPKWMTETKSYSEFKLYKNVYYSKISEVGASYLDGYYLEKVYTSAGDYSITFTENNLYENAYVYISSSEAVSINGELLTIDTPTWVQVSISNSSIILTSDGATTLKILDFKLYTISAETSDFTRFLTPKDNTETFFSSITEEFKFVYLSEDSDSRKWFIQFESTYSETNPSTNPSLTRFYGNLDNFLDKNLSLATGELSNPFIHTFIYKEKEAGDELALYIKGLEVVNIPNNIIYIDQMKYNALTSSIDIGDSLADNGLFLNEALLVNNNLQLAGSVVINNERMTAINNCIDVNKVQAGKSSVNGVTNVQLLSGGNVVYEFEFPPIIYDELIHHISFNILLNR